MDASFVPDSKRSVSVASRASSGCASATTTKRRRPASASSLTPQPVVACASRMRAAGRPGSAPSANARASRTGRSPARASRPVKAKPPEAARPGPCFGSDGSGSASSRNAVVPRGTRRLTVYVSVGSRAPVASSDPSGCRRERRSAPRLGARHLQRVEGRLAPGDLPLEGRQLGRRAGASASRARAHRPRAGARRGARRARASRSRAPARRSTCPAPPRRRRGPCTRRCRRTPSAGSSPSAGTGRTCGCGTARRRSSSRATRRRSC